MTIYIITGTITGRDVFGSFKELLKSGIGYQWFYTKRGWGYRKNKNIKYVSGNLGQQGVINIVQTTGSGKTILAAVRAYKAAQQGKKVVANMPIKNGIEISTFEEFIELKNSHILLDDIRHVITSFGGDESKIASEAANGSRKKFNTLDITTQRLENFVPPDIRKITDEYHVPIIRCFDGMRKSPDKRNYYPLEIMDLRFSSGLDFLDMKRYNLAGETGQKILDSFNTLDISSELT